MSRWRAVLRLAARDARRGLGRSSLVALMVLVPVLLATVGSVAARSAELDPQDVVRERLGTGAVQARVFGGFDGNAAEQNLTGESLSGWGEEALPTSEVERRLREVVGTRNRLVPQNNGPRQVLVLGERIVRTDVAELDVRALGAGAPVTIATGRAPVTDDEVLVRASAGGSTVVPEGARFTFLDGTRVFTVVGTYRASDPFGLAEVVGRPGALVDPRSLETGPFSGASPRGWFVVGPDPVSWAQVQQVNAFGGFVLSRAAVAEDPAIAPELVGGGFGPDTEAIVTVGVVIALVLLQIMLMVGPAIAVGARRNERLLAVVGASGGAPRHLAGVVLAGAAVVGLLGSLAGAALGAGAGAVVVRLYAAYLGEAVPRVDVHAADLTGLVLVGTLTAVVAAGLPALRVSRLARWAPVSARFALRDAARQRSRTVPALAATVAAVAAASAVLVLGASQAEADARSYRQQAAVGTGWVQVGSGGLDAPRDQAGRVATALRESLGVRDVVYGYGAGSTTDTELYRYVNVLLPEVCLPTRGCSQTGYRVLFVDPAAASVIAPDSDRVGAALAAGSVVVFDAQVLDRDGRLPLTVTLDDGATAPVTTPVPALLVDGPQRLDFVLAPRALAERLGVELVPETAYVRPAAAPTPLQLARLDLALARIETDLSYAVETPRERSGDEEVFLVFGALAVLVALAGTFIAVGLAAADARPDLGTLAAVGADPSVRRRIGAGQAGAIAVPGALVGGAAGILAGAVLVRLNSVSGNYQIVDLHLVVPPGRTLALVVAVPLLAVALGWLTVRSRLDVVRRLGE
ncbi:FtsX-like permease family protein [Kineosporia sp. A_224]|uniref:FtsX-like permease family protein n=1 Tax=Kineosporia sp. A_224 TaxID=1962180 RepID=UPI000B4A8728|nr:FtsX-like permease family protein [Kineosporia sp. A_224]